MVTVRPSARAVSAASSTADHLTAEADVAAVVPGARVDLLQQLVDRGAERGQHAAVAGRDGLHAVLAEEDEVPGHRLGRGVQGERHRARRPAVVGEQQVHQAARAVHRGHPGHPAEHRQDDGERVRADVPQRAALPPPLRVRRTGCPAGRSRRTWWPGRAASRRPRRSRRGTPVTFGWNRWVKKTTEATPDASAAATTRSASARLERQRLVQQQVPAGGGGPDGDVGLHVRRQRHGDRVARLDQRVDVVEGRHAVPLGQLGGLAPGSDPRPRRARRGDVRRWPPRASPPPSDRCRTSRTAARYLPLSSSATATPWP